MSARLVPPVRDLVGQHPRAAGLSPEQAARLLWLLRFVSAKPDPYEVADALAVLDIEREAA